MTKLFSLCHVNNQLKPVEVEVTLTPGLPVLQVLGLPDQHLRESAARIKSAIRAQGFEFPKAQGVLVNLRPSYFKKTSKGLELAIAAALLRETGQLKFSTENNIFYGELSLYGDVDQPEDLEDYQSTDTQLSVTTGRLKFPVTGLNIQSVATLRDLVSPQKLICENEWPFERPSFGLDYKYPISSAKFLQVSALAKLNLLLAGPSGAGKSTIAQFLQSLSEPFTWAEFRELSGGARSIWYEQKWRPLIKPHHTTPTLSLIGGGAHPWAGEISKAHGGILVMDEFLEFSTQVQEALREPMEEKRVRISRSGKYREFPFDAQIVATTNLCPCGDWTPDRIVRCRFSLRKCQSVLSRLSGPIVDRFDMICFLNPKPLEERVDGYEILEKIETARAWVEAHPTRERVNEELLILMPTSMQSQRRRQSTLRVARALADLEQSEKLKRHHLLEALSFSYYPFEKLKMGFN